MSRRRFLALTTVTGLLGACNSDGTATETTARSTIRQRGQPDSAPTTAGAPSITTVDGSPGSTAQAPGRAEGFPRTVGRDFATATIEAPPERVVATADRDQLDVLLAMGVEPVLYGRSGDYEQTAPWIDPAAVDDLDSVDMPGAFEPNVESIYAARPDLIVDAWSDQSLHSTLSQIAPTIEIKLDNTDSWQSAQRLAGEAMGTEDAAEEAIITTERVLAEHAARLAELSGLSVAIAFIDTGELVMIPGNEIGGRIFTELGLTVHPTPDGTSGRYSIEELDELLGDADMIVSFDYGKLGTQENNPLFMGLPAVQNGRYVALDVDTATACYQESTISIRWAASRVADALLT